MKRRSPTNEPPEQEVFVDRDLAGKRFLAILRDASIRVVDHNDHFGPTTPDGEWLANRRCGWRFRIVTSPARERTDLATGQIRLVLVADSPRESAPLNEIAHCNQLVIVRKPQPGNESVKRTRFKPIEANCMPEI